MRVRHGSTRDEWSPGERGGAGRPATRPRRARLPWSSGAGWGLSAVGSGVSGPTESEQRSRPSAALFGSFVRISRILLLFYNIF